MAGGSYHLRSKPAELHLDFARLLCAETYVLAGVGAVALTLALVVLDSRPAALAASVRLAGE